MSICTAGVHVVCQHKRQHPDQTHTQCALGCTPERCSFAKLEAEMAKNLTEA